ncbi:hypothetical protein FOZ62_009096 [Perkinsus olseni]|uniref:Uncharacterized protein n=1 Tax=Perkinsus olseni TaxID=32597 RepID=A0A7J6STH7_PEROL|nr:hypothetical protein FOZ62_009096 [Perkinsus olseni]
MTIRTYPPLRHNSPPPTRREGICLRLRALNNLWPLSDGLLWLIWLHVVRPRLTLSPLYSEQIEGSLLEMDSFGENSFLVAKRALFFPNTVIEGRDMSSPNLTTLFDAFEIEGSAAVMFTDGEILYYIDDRLDGVMRVSLDDDTPMRRIPLPPSGTSRFRVYDGCARNGYLFIAGYSGDIGSALFKMRLPLLRDFPECPHEDFPRNCPLESVEWEAAAVLPFSTPTLEIDVRVRSDGEYQIVALVSGDPHFTSGNDLFYANFEGNGRLGNYRDIESCKLVPNHDEVVCVAWEYRSLETYICLIDMWDLTLLSLLMLPVFYLVTRPRLPRVSVTEGGHVIIVLQQSGNAGDDYFDAIVSAIR